MYCRNCGKEITEEAAFCMYCGTVLEQEQEKEEAEVITDNKKGRKGLLALVLILGLILLIAYGMYQQAPIGKIERALENGQIDEANSAFNDLEERDDMYHAKNMAKEYMTQLVQNYIGEKESYDYSYVIGKLAELAFGILAEEEEVGTQIDFVERINTSRTKYATALKYQEDGNIADAINAYKEVISEDTKYYAEAQVQLQILINELRENSLGSAKACITEQDYEGAKIILETALEAIPADSQLVSELEIVNDKLKENEIKDIIEKVEGLIEESDYIQAFALIKKAVNNFPESASVEAQYEKVKSNYKETQLNKLQELLQQEAFSQVVLLLNETLEYLPWDQEVKDLLTRYESYLPVSMVSLEIYDKSCVHCNIWG